MAGRSEARRVVLQMLYLTDQNPDADTRWIKQSVEDQLPDGRLQDFAWSLITGVRERRADLDERIAAVAKNWRLDRMAATDRNVLRLGCFELQFTDTPAPVVLNECVELAREFGAENSSGFVNGILDKLAPETTSGSVGSSLDES